MKVVINSKYGGFSLSAAAMRRMVERKAAGVESDTISHYTGGNGWRAHDKFVDLGGGWQAQTLGGDTIGVLVSGDTVYRWDRHNRTDAELVKAVEEMGDEASGMCASLKIVEIPDGIEYKIEEYDGREWIAEKHATWQ